MMNSFDPRETIQVNNYAYKKVIMLSVDITFIISKQVFTFSRNSEFAQCHNCFSLLSLSINIKKKQPKVFYNLKNNI